MKSYRLGLAALSLAFVAALLPSVVFAQDVESRESAAQENAASETATDDSIFDVPDGKEPSFYVDLYPKIMKAAGAEGEKAHSPEEIERYWKHLEKALRSVFLNTLESEEAIKTREEAFFMLTQVLHATGNYEVAKELHDKVTNKNYLGLIDGVLVPAAVAKAIREDDRDALNKEIENFFALRENADVAYDADDINALLKGYDAELALEFAKRVVEEFKDGNEFQKEIADLFIGVVRFNNLVGNEMKIEGLFLDGKEIDWNSYRGKVVLVDFWATWCGPCLAEVPNVLEQYKKYHDAGFEVIGYSLDDDLDVLKKFEEEHKLPWKTLSRALSVKSKEEGGKEYVNLVEYYSIQSIPTMVLVGKDGKVLDIRARGKRLNKDLEEQFPDVK